MATDTATTHGSSTAERREALKAKLHPLNMPLRHQLGLLGLVGFGLVPTLLYPDQMRPYTNLLYLIMFAMSWDVVSGYTGQLSFGHAFFFALGGYGSAVLNMQHGVSPALSIPIAMLIAAIGGILVGVPALRLRGPYLSLVTLIVPVIFVKLLILFNDSLILNIPTTDTTWFSIPIAPGGLGGASGLAGIPDPLFQTGQGAVVDVAPLLSVLPERFTAFQVAILAEYYYSLALLIVVTAVLLAVTRSSAGSVFTAIREDEDAVAAAGLNPAKFKLFAFVLSAAVGGLAGATLVHTSLAIAQPGPLLGGAGQAGSPIQVSINVIIMAILGGTGTIVGAAVGAVFFGVTTAVLGALNFTIPVLGKTLGAMRPLPLLLAAMVVLTFLPGGLLRFGIRAGRNLLANARGESTESGPDFEDTAVGQIVDNYRSEIDEITGGDGGEKR